MHDREKIINGLEKILADNPFDSRYDAINEAVAFLKAIKPVKKPSYESRAKAPCTCGKKHPTTWYGVSNTGRRFTTVKCNECGKSAEGITEIDAIRAWNAMVKGE